MAVGLELAMALAISRARCISAAGSTIWCTKPYSRASLAPKIRPVRASSVARRVPKAATTARKITKGQSPMRISVRPKVASSAATTMWQFAAKPVPPASAAPCTAAISGLVMRIPAVKMRSCTSLISSPPGDSASFKSMPAQNDLPLPLSRTAPTPGSPAASSSAAASAPHKSRFSALRRSGLFSARCRTRPSRLICKLSLIDIDLHGQQGCAQGLALRVGAQRDGPATAQGVMQHQVQRAEIGQFKAVDAAFDDLAEEHFDTLRRHFPQQDRIVLRLPRDHSDIRNIALVSGTGVSDAREGHLHSITSTRVWISPRGIRAGQYATIWRTSGRPSP